MSCLAEVRLDAACRCSIHDSGLRASHQLEKLEAILRRSSTVMSRELFGGASSSPPPPDTLRQKNLALWVNWACTGISLAIIVARLAGRWSRTAKFFLDDKVIAFSIIPLCGRMAAVYMMILYGTNNVTLDGITPDQIEARKYGSKLVLAARLTFTAL